MNIKSTIIKGVAFCTILAGTVASINHNTQPQETYIIHHVESGEVFGHSLQNPESFIYLDTIEFPEAKTLQIGSKIHATFEEESLTSFKEVK